MIARARAEAAGELDDRVGGDVREREVRLRQLVRAEVAETDLERDAVVCRVPRGDLDRLRVEVDGDHRREAELRRRDR